MLPSKLRQRRAKDPILPHHHPHSLPTSSSSYSIRRKRGSSSRFSWHSNIVVGSICLSITLLAVVMVMWSLTLRSSNDHHAKKSHTKSRAESAEQHQDHHKPQQADRKSYLLPRKRTDSSKQTWVDCPNGSRGILNDNYCDCSDGSDEPLTSACAHLTPQVPTFPCQDGSGLLLFASRVGDGVQDCGDGSDER